MDFQKKGNCIIDLTFGNNNTVYYFQKSKNDTLLEGKSTNVKTGDKSSIVFERV